MKSKTVQTIMFVLICFLTSFHLNAQTYLIGHKQITYTDPARSNRSIPCEIYYPATSAGENTPIAQSSFPILVFGHGFVMGYDAYQSYWDSIVPHGYIMIFPTTEGSMIPTPNHLSFGLDIAFMVTKMQSEGSLSTSFFYNKVASTSAILGHSMGGKGSVIASSSNTNITTTISFGMSNSNSPDAIAVYAPSVTVPALVFSGANDCVATPVDNQVPLYNALGSQCKTFISITGGSHCQFAESNFNCNFGETTCSPDPTITRDQQHAIVLSLLMPYLDYMLKNNAAAGILYNSLLTTSSDITYQKNCNVSGINIINNKPSFKCNPNPVINNVQIQMEKVNLPVSVFITDLTGRIIFHQKSLNSNLDISLGSIESGSYIVVVSNDQMIISQKLIKE